MARKPRHDRSKTNELKKRLESGQSVEGLVGYVETNIVSSDGVSSRYTRYDDETNRVIIKVKCLRVETECDVKVVAVPMSGKGEFYINPCQWFDKPKDLEEHKKYLQACEDACKRLRVMFGHNYLRDRKADLIDFVQGMGEVEMEAFRLEMIESRGVGKDTEFHNLLRTIDESTCRSYAKPLVCQQYGVDPSDVRFAT